MTTPEFQQAPLVDDSGKVFEGFPFYTPEAADLSQHQGNEVETQEKKYLSALADFLIRFHDLATNGTVVEDSQESAIPIDPLFKECVVKRLLAEGHDLGGTDNPEFFNQAMSLVTRAHVEYRKLDLEMLPFSD